MEVQQQAFKGKNGLTVLDNGDYWRVIGSGNVTTPQILDYRDRNEQPTGVKYGIGVDRLTGKTRISHVDYPKDMYPIDWVTNSEEPPKIVMRCNVCYAMDQAAKARGSHPLEPSSPQENSLVPVEQSRRLSVGDVGSVVLPKYFSFLAQLGKNFALKPGGDLAISFGVSLLADILSGVSTDPGYKRALQSISDGAIDSIGGGNPDQEFFNQVKEDGLAIFEAWHKDGDAVAALQKGLFKSRDDLAREVKSSKDHTQQQNQSYQPTYLPSPGSDGGYLRQPRFPFE
jgi:hypothetical protein